MIPLNEFSGSILNFLENKEWQVQGEARSVTAIGWNGKYWLVCTKGKLLRLKGNKLELAADLSSLGLGSSIPYCAGWNGEYWLISYRKIVSGVSSGACLLKYDGKDVELLQAPDDLSLISFRKSHWPIDLGEVVWGDGR